MREIIDKHFYDNWVIAYYVGYVIDLSDQWFPYKSAFKLISLITEPPNVEKLTDKHLQMMEDYTKKCLEYLREGVLNTEYVLNNVGELLKCVAYSNIAVRWLLLHR